MSNSSEDNQPWWRAAPWPVWAFGLLLAVLVTLPTVAGMARTPDGWVFTGAPAVPGGMQWDYNVQVARMWQGYEPTGSLFKLPVTHEDHRAIPLVQGFYVALGVIGRVLPVGIPALYHAARFALALGLAPALWVFSGRFFEDRAGRWLGVLFGTVVGGWSWILLALAPDMTANVSPIEFWLTDAFNLLGALYLPHFTAAIILQIAAVLLADTWIVRGGAGRLLGLTLALAALSLIQPYIVPLMAALVGGMALLALIERRLTVRRALWLALPFGVHGGLSLYQFLAMRSDPIWRSFVEQNQTLSPAPIYYLTGYLPFLLPIALGALRSGRGAFGRRFFIPALWVITVVVLLYLPLPTQRRYLMGVQTPLGMLAARGWICGVLTRLAPRRRPLVTTVYLMFGSIALLLMLVGNIRASSPAETPALYLSPDERAALAWLDEHAGRDELVLTTSNGSYPGSGGMLASMAGRRVYVGHWIETADFGNKLDTLERFYDSNTSDAWRREFLDEIGARLIWYDADARALGAWNPADAPYLTPGFTSDDVTVFLVDRAALAQPR
jgi:hypothetical protein